jgi:hypothetical protein
MNAMKKPNGIALSMSSSISLNLYNSKVGKRSQLIPRNWET